MKGKTFFKMVVGCVAILTSCSKQEQSLALWYEQPAGEWMQSLPIGNGRLGAMIYGGVDVETIALNESSMWSGQRDAEQETAFGKERLEALRKLFFEGRLSEGNRIAGDSLRGIAHSFGTHLPVGDLKIRFIYPDTTENVTSYRRSLDLERAVCSTSFKRGAVKYEREYIATNPQDAIVMRFTADKKGAVSFVMGLDLLRDAAVSADGERLIFEGQALLASQGPGGVLFKGNIALKIENGTVERGDDNIKVTGADAVTIVADIRTNYKNDGYRALCDRTVENIIDVSYEDIKEEHIKDYTSLFDRVTLKLGDDDKSDIPVDERWKTVKEGGHDAALSAMFFQYGRYLFIASSRQNSPLPIALQGFFNDNLACNMPWTNDYHLDINTQQNYWLANVGNMAEGNAPLFSYIADLAKDGAATVQKVYGCKGWTAHTTANIWGFTAPSPGMGWGLFPGAGTWIASHLWTQYEFTQDKQYLKEVAYPLLKGNAIFYLDFLTEDPKTGCLVAGPSISPENAFGYEGNNLCASMMPTCERVLVHELFSYCIKSSEILSVDNAFADSLRAALDKLPPIRINRYGGVREWMEDYEDVYPNHRHTSHLMALYPFAQIRSDRTPELWEAAKKTLERRLAAEGWEDTEWSRANAICYYARLREPQKAAESVEILIGKLSRENLFTISPAGIAGAASDIFAFDGNTAGAAGIAEMLLQSHEDKIEFLPCLPDDWSEGCFSGLCARGGAEVSVTWKEHQMERAEIKAAANYLCRFKIPVDREYEVFLNGTKKNFLPDDEHCISIDVKQGDVIEIQ